MADEKRPGIGEGIRTGIGMLAAFKEAVEETLQEAIDRGDLTQERARATLRDTMGRVQESLDDARERFDVASRRELDELRAEVRALRDRVDRLENGGDGGAVGAGIPVD